MERRKGGSREKKTRRGAERRHGKGSGGKHDKGNKKQNRKVTSE